MKLYYSETSPYARLVRVVIQEVNLMGQVQPVIINPWEELDDLGKVSPAGKVPALEMEGGAVLIESGLICEQILELSRRKDLNVTDLAARQRLALGRNLMDCAFGVVGQKLFAEGSTLEQRWRAAVPRLLASLEDAYAEVTWDLTLADLTVACALEYLEFRLPEFKWQEAAPKLADAVAAISARPSMTSTSPAPQKVAAKPVSGHAFTNRFVRSTWIGGV